MVWHICNETVLDPYSLVGGSCHLVASCCLVHLHVSKHGLFIPRSCLIGCLGNIYLDFYRILSSPFPFPHEDQELLVRPPHTHTFFLCVLHFIYLVVTMNPLQLDANVIVEPFQGKHGTLSYSRIPSQAPNGPPSTRLSSCLNSYYVLSCKHLIIQYILSCF